jgi:hypothetical protein
MRRALLPGYVSGPALIPPRDGGPFTQFQVPAPQVRFTTNTLPSHISTPRPTFEVTVRLSLLPMSPFTNRMPPWPSIVTPAEFSQTPLCGAI